MDYYDVPAVVAAVRSLVPEIGSRFMVEVPTLNLVPAGDPVIRVWPAELEQPSVEAIRQRCADHAAGIYTKDELQAMARQAKNDLEAGGIVVNGRALDTSLKSQNRLANARLALFLDPAKASMQFDGESNEVISRDEFLAIAKAVADWSDACFLALGPVSTAIEAGEITGLDGIKDPKRWPNREITISTGSAA